MVTLVIATRNQGKVKEFREMLEGYPVSIKTLHDYPQVPEIVEDGMTFEENARKKAEVISNTTGAMVLADDSGLEVEFLGGSPGVLSARFAGEGASDQDNNHKLLQLLEGVPDEQRKACFTCFIAISYPGRETIIISGHCQGRITRAPRGKGGFGYDPLFLVPEYDQTFAQLEPGLKNRISHRGMAMQKAREVLEGLLSKY